MGISCAAYITETAREAPLFVVISQISPLLPLINIGDYIETIRTNRRFSLWYVLLNGALVGIMRSAHQKRLRHTSAQITEQLASLAALDSASIRNVRAWLSQPKASQGVGNY